MIDCNAQVTDGPAPSSWSSNPGMGQVSIESHRRLRTLLNIDGEADPAVLAAIGKYGLGTTRSFDQYQHFVGANTSAMTQLSNRSAVGISHHTLTVTH